MGVWARAEAWAALIDGEVIKTRSDLARHLGVSRARVSQVLAVHSVHADVREVLRAAEKRGHPLRESGWRRIKGLQRQQALQILGEVGVSPPEREHCELSSVMPPEVSGTFPCG